MNDKKGLTAKHIIIYLLIFFSFWSLRELVIQPIFLTPLSPVFSALIGEIIKLSTWTLPAVLLIKHFHNDMEVSLKEMFTSKLQWHRDYLFALVFVLVLIVRPLHGWLIHGNFELNPNFVPENLIGAVLFVGITEELVFRGFLLNAFLKKMELKYAIALDAVLFALIHYPIWLYRGFTLPEIMLASVQVAFLSAGFAYSFIKTRNIFVPIALHMVWNFSIILFLR